MNQRIRVLLFAAARQWAGTEALELDASALRTVGDVRAAVLAAVPQLDRFGPRLLFAVDGEFATDQTLISPRTEVACIPPVSGG